MLTIRKFWFTLHERLFYSRNATGVTVALGAVVLIGIYYILQWSVLNAVYAPNPKACYSSSGACWGFVVEKWRLILFGRFPYDQQWRPAIATLCIITMLCVTAYPRFWRKRLLMTGWTAALIIFFTMMYGGILSLEKVDTDMWGGLPLTVILTLLGMTVCIPLGVLLAIGRRSELPLIRLLSTGYIELVRGVPLITVLFVASFIFPLLMPAGIRIDAFWRVAGGIILFQAAYIAETVRGGLQTVPKGQFLAADALGLNPIRKYLYIILPQALVAVIPAFVNSLLSTFMDTSLVTVVSMYDLTGSLSLALGDANWRDFFREGYIFIAAIYFVSCFLMSRYSFWLEKHLTSSKVTGTL